MPFDVAANAIAGKQRGSAEEGVPGAFKVHRRRKVFDRKTMLRKPDIEVRRLTSPNVVTKGGAKKPVSKDQASIGGEDEVRQSLMRRHQFNGDAEINQ